MRAFYFLGVTVLAGTLAAQINYDESKVAPYTLPDPLVLASGTRVASASVWYKQRRPEILHLFETHVYGRTPATHARTSFTVVSVDKNALGGKAIRKQVRVHFSAEKDGPKMDLLVYVPAGARGRVPVFLDANFAGNHTLNKDPGIRLGEVWVREAASRNDPRAKELVKHVRQVAKEEARGSTASRWPLEKILARGYALATFCYQDVEPDFAGGMRYGVRPLFFRAAQTEPGPEDWGAIGAWAWGLSRAADYLQTDKDIDAKKIVVMGHSRLGKTALWAGAQDARFAIVISNDSGEGGAALSRRNFGETVKVLNTAFPHWFCANYRQYSDHADRLPVDQHMLLALIAPRPVYVASAVEDRWADPRGEFLAAVAAGKVYALLGKQGLGTDRMPGLHQPIMKTIGYHIRAGKHDVTTYDWEQYLTFADRQFGVASQARHGARR
jgi:hypothetical protein